MSVRRRAKLKRLTIEDRECVMRSRAPLEEFDVTQGIFLRFKQSVKQRQKETIECHAELLASFPKKLGVDNDWGISIPEVSQGQYPYLPPTAAVNVRDFTQHSIPINFENRNERFWFKNDADPSAMFLETAEGLADPSTLGLNDEDLLLMHEDYAPPIFSVSPQPVSLAETLRPYYSGEWPVSSTSVST